MADSSNNITFNNNSATFRYGSGAITALTLDNRAFELNNTNGTIDNANSTHAITINSDLIASGGGAKTLTLSGGNATPNNVFAGDIANETDGGLGIVSVTKSGNSRWTLAGTNTYSGNTTVSAGTLTLSDTSSTLFQIAASEVNNAILGTGTVNLDGMFVFDLTSASTNPGDFWGIVDVGTLSESYGSTFGVISTLGSFSEAGGIWSIDENGRTYEFSQTTGVLTVIPEPSAALLGGLGLLALLRRRR